MLLFRTICAIARDAIRAVAGLLGGRANSAGGSVPAAALSETRSTAFDSAAVKGEQGPRSGACGVRVKPRPEHAGKMDYG